MAGHASFEPPRTEASPSQAALGVAIIADGRHKLLSDQHFRAIVEAVPAAIYATDAQGRITFYNEAAAELWGCRPTLDSSEFCGSWKLYWPDGTPLPHDECPMAMALKQKRPIRGMEAVAERPDGTRVSFQPYPTPLFDEAGELIGGVNLLIDLTDRNQGEVAMQRLAAIIEYSDDAIISKDLNGIITSWNRGAERVFGYTADEAVGQPITMLMPPERHDEEPDILRRIRSGERMDHYETVRCAKDGTLIDVSLTVSPIINRNGRVIGASKIARDISARRRTEQIKDLLIGEMTHRIKNTIATVQAIAHRTLRNVTKEERTAFSARLHALAGAHDVLTNEDWERARVGNLVRRALQPYEEQHRARYRVDGPDGVTLDPNRSTLVMMALHELATNAMKYGALSNATGQVTVSWEVGADRKLTLRWQESGGPTVEPPAAQGFGSFLIERAFNGEQGHATWTFDPSGVRWTAELPL
jgi:PAS domain S-box-containing protein